MKLLTELKDINGCSFRPMGTIFRKTYTLMGVPSCISEELLIQDDMVLEATRMTKRNNTKLANLTDMVKLVLTGKEQSARFTQRYGSFRMRPFVKGPQQCFNCQKYGHHARTCRSEIHICRYCAGTHHSHQCKDNKHRTLKCANYGHEHATTSRLCPKGMDAEKKANTAPASQRTTHTQDSKNSAIIPLANAWATFAVQEVEKRSLSCQPSIPITTPTTIEQPMEVSTKQSKPTAKNSIPKTMQNRKSEPEKVGPALQQTTNAWTEPSMKEFPVATSANRTERFLSENHCQPISKPHKQNQQTEEQMDEVLEKYTLHSPVQHLYSGVFLSGTLVKYMHLRE